jgi:hypothetical protein
MPNASHVALKPTVPAPLPLPHNAGGFFLFSFLSELRLRAKELPASPPLPAPVFMNGMPARLFPLRLHPGIKIVGEGAACLASRCQLLFP